MRDQQTRKNVGLAGALRSLLLPLSVFSLLPAVLAEQSVTLAWDPNPETDIGGYIVYYGPASRNYTNAVNVGNVTTNTVLGLVDGATYYFAVTAYNTNGLESDFSDEVSYSGPDESPVLRALAPLLTRSNVTLRGTCSVPLPAIWFELRAGSATNWTRYPASAGPTNTVVLLLTPTNWTARLCASNTASVYVSPPIQFRNVPLRVPVRLRFEVQLIETAALDGTNGWREVARMSVPVELPPDVPQKFYKAIILSCTIPSPTFP